MEELHQLLSEQSKNMYSYVDLRIQSCPHLPSCPVKVVNKDLKMNNSYWGLMTWMPQLAAVLTVILGDFLYLTKLFLCAAFNTFNIEHFYLKTKNFLLPKDCSSCPLKYFSVFVTSKYSRASDTFNIKKRTRANTKCCTFRLCLFHNKIFILVFLFLNTEMCFGSLSCCITQGRINGSMNMKKSRSWSCKESPVHYVCMVDFFWNTVAVLNQMNLEGCMSECFTFVLSSSRIDILGSQPLSLN